FVRQLASQPYIYIGNVINNFIKFIIYPQKYFEAKFWPSLAGESMKSDGFLQTIFSNYYQVTTVLALVFIAFLAYQKSLSAKLALFLLLYLAASYSFTFLDERYLYGRIPIVLFSLAITSKELIALLKNRPIWISIVRDYIVPGLSAILVASPVI